MARISSRHKRLRKQFGTIREITEIPDLLQILKRSYQYFLKSGEGPEPQPGQGLRGAFDSVFPIRNPDGSAELEFIEYKIEPPRFDAEECQTRDLSYGAPLKATFRLNAWEVDADSGERRFRHSKDQSVFLGDLPMMTESGTFVVNGAERVVVSQLQRSPGVYFYRDSGKRSASRRLRYGARVIPARGVWLELEFDVHNKILVRLEKDVRPPVTTLLYAYGLEREEILRALYPVREFRRLDADQWEAEVDVDALRGTVLKHDLVDSKTGEVAATRGTRIDGRALRKLRESGIRTQLVTTEFLVGKPSAGDIVDRGTGIVRLDAGALLTRGLLDDSQLGSVEMLNIPEGGGFVSRMIEQELDLERTSEQYRAEYGRGDDRETALVFIYRYMRHSEPPSIATAEEFFQGLFLDPSRYDLSSVGRAKLNDRLGLEDVSENEGRLRREDVIAVLRELEAVRVQGAGVDDIDHLGNRRVRSVGELIEQQYRAGLSRMATTIRERIKRISAAELETLKPEDLVNARSVVSIVREFFAGSPLSQFMDQTNPLSEMAHKRRISALGPGGLNRRNASFDVRDVHRTHYGRICPIETPEGQNIGLVNSFAAFARVNRHGFIETPFRRVEKGRVTEEIVYLSAAEEIDRYIAQANEPLTADDRLAAAEVLTRKDDGDSETFQHVPRNQVEFIDVSPKQVVSVSASLIPFLENDDANRALMGSNMQRQAVPLIETEAPFVGTGIEEIVARDCGSAIAARRAGVVDQVDSSRIVVQASGRLDAGARGVDIYRLRKFQRSNQGTAINQRPLVKKGDRVEKGDVIADGPSTDFGELALGRNVLVAFMPWQGYNFEDSILVSERIVREDAFTSIHIEEYEVSVRDTKLGPEKLERNPPNISNAANRRLDESGIVSIGAWVEAGDILVGKVTPKSETPITPEERLFRSIFGERGSDVRDSSLRMPPGDQGVVVDVQIFSRKGDTQDLDRKLIVKGIEENKLKRDRADEESILRRSMSTRLRDLLRGAVASAPAPEAGIAAGDKLRIAVLRELDCEQLFKLAVEKPATMSGLEQMHKRYLDDSEEIRERYRQKHEKLEADDELRTGEIKVIKVYVAVKRRLQAGDKMAGRHGNKGVISRVLPEEDMPFLADGTPIDIVLNPLGVPSRMNVGQVLETHLGWAAHGLGRVVTDALDAHRAGGGIGKLRKALEGIYGKEEVTAAAADERALVELAEQARNGVHFATPVFDGVRAEKIGELLAAAGLDQSGQEVLYDGRSGERFDRKVTIGYKYLMKLDHLVDDKIHARSTGPYSLVTQQPVRGKSRFGGQRVGEMEVWALQAYGAAHTLREILTYKSDDVGGRARAYESIARQKAEIEPGRPESFNVLVNELKALGMNVELRSDEDFFESLVTETPPPQLPQ